jgi:thiol-disulfide isomerase/thioredoxin
MQPNRVRITSLAAGLILILAACGGGGRVGTGETASSASGSGSAVAFTAAKLGGGTLSSTSFKGKDTVLWFWAPWCTVCRGEAPNVTAAAAEFKGKVDVIGVAGRGEVPAMKGFVSDTHTDSLIHVVDDSGAIWSSYGVAAQPSFAFINQDGTVKVVIGALGKDGLTQQMNALVAS